jgi:hypothetical protein
MTPNGLYNSSGYYAKMFVTATYHYNNYGYNETYIETSGTGDYTLPVVAVANNIAVKQGTGKQEDPYILIKPEPEQDPVEDPTTDEPEPQVKAEEEEVENPQTGRFKNLWILPIIAFGLYILYTQINKMGFFKNNYKEN